MKCEFYDFCFGVYANACMCDSGYTTQTSENETNLFCVLVLLVSCKPKPFMNNTEYATTIRVN